MSLEITNTYLDGQVTGENPDAGGDFYLLPDHNRDMHYNHGKIVEALKHISNTHEAFQIIYGGEVTDSGSGQIDISAGVAIGKDASGNLKLIEIPAITNLSIPTGWNDNRQIWVIGEHKYITTGATRNHDETSESYNPIAIDSYKGVTVTNDLFVDADPTGNYVIWGSFKMSSGNVFTKMYSRSQLFYGLYPSRGLISGSLEFQSTTTPPIVKSGVRESLGILRNLASDYTMTLASDYFQNSWTTFDTYQWYRVVMDSRDGTFKYIHAFDTSSTVVTGTVSDVSVAAGTATITMSNNTGLIAANGHIIVIQLTALGSGTMTNLVGRVVSVADSTHCTVKTSYAGTSPGAVTGTYSAYFRIQTLHGGSTNITTDADVEKYTPSPLFCNELNGYYTDSAGIPTSSASLAVYRQLGVFYVHTGPVVKYVYSYKSWKNKNDNALSLRNSTGYGSTATMIATGFTLTRAHGNDYTYNISAVNGDSVTILKECLTYNSIFGQEDTNGIRFCTSKNSSQVTTTVDSVTDDLEIIYTYSAPGVQESNQRTIQCIYGDVLRVHTNGTAIGGGHNIKYNFIIE